MMTRTKKKIQKIQKIQKIRKIKGTKKINQANKATQANKQNRPRTFKNNDFYSGDGFVTSIWGPAQWHILHTISFNYPVNPTNEQKQQYKQYLLSLQHVLPCGACRKNLTKNFKRLPPVLSHFKNRDTFSKYIYQLHELVNKMLHKKNTLTYCDVRERYEHFRARCTNEDIKNDTKNDIKNDTKNDIKNDTKNDIKNDTKNDTKNDIKNDINIVPVLKKHNKTLKKNNKTNDKNKEDDKEDDKKDKNNKNKKEKGCTEPLYGKKARCIINIVPQENKGQSIQINPKCIKHRTDE